jgi:hypothetical protein
VTTLAALNARFVTAGGPGACARDGVEQPLREGVGVVMDCPCGGLSACVGPLYIAFVNATDGGSFLDGGGHQRDGDSIETLTLSAPIERLGGCGWLGWIESGSALTEG